MSTKTPVNFSSMLGASGGASAPTQEGVPTLFLGPLNYGLVVHPADAAFKNAYSREIAQLRIETVVSAFIDRMLREPGHQRFSDCVVAIADSAVHPEGHPSDSASGLALFLFEQCKRLEAVFQNVLVVAVSGNPDSATARDYDRQCYSTLETLCASSASSITVWHSSNPQGLGWHVYDTPYVLVPSYPMSLDKQGANEQEPRGLEHVRATGIAFRKETLQRIQAQSAQEQVNAHSLVLLAGHPQGSVDAHKAGFISAGALGGADAYTPSNPFFTPERPCAMAWVTRPNRGITSVVELLADENALEQMPEDDHMTPIRAFQWNVDSSAQQQAQQHAA